MEELLMVDLVEVLTVDPVLPMAVEVAVVEAAMVEATLSQISFCQNVLAFSQHFQALEQDSTQVSQLKHKLYKNPD